MKTLVLALLLGMCLSTAACGKKGPLYLPPLPSKEGDTQTIPAPVPQPSDSRY